MQTSIRWTVITALLFFFALVTCHVNAETEHIFYGTSAQNLGYSEQAEESPEQFAIDSETPSHTVNRSKSTSVAPQLQKDMGRDAQSSTAITPDPGEFNVIADDSPGRLQLDNIKPLYSSPVMPGEGLWTISDCPRDTLGRPILFKTFYRPSADFPNAIVFMMVVDMSKVVMRYYVGKHEPGASQARSRIESEAQSNILAVTNALWMQQHSRGAGAIFRKKAIYPMVDGMATLIIYTDGSVDIREWSSEIPLGLVSDARQLRHLIVKNGIVIQTIAKGSRLEDSEIGLGDLLGGGGKDRDGKHFWFVAHRSAFGIRKDGNLVFAIGHHIGTKDLAKALVLAGCERAMHADANPNNVLGILYIRDPSSNVVTKLKLSPEQSQNTLNRYEQAYTKDFFAFFARKSSGYAGHTAIRGDKSAR